MSGAAVLWASSSGAVSILWLLYPALLHCLNCRTSGVDKASTALLQSQQSVVASCYALVGYARKEQVTYHSLADFVLVFYRQPISPTWCVSDCLVDCACYESQIRHVIRGSVYIVRSSHDVPRRCKGGQSEKGRRQLCFASGDRGLPEVLRGPASAQQAHPARVQDRPRPAPAVVRGFGLGGAGRACVGGVAQRAIRTFHVQEEGRVGTGVLPMEGGERLGR